MRNLRLVGMAAAGAMLFAVSAQALILTEKTPEQACRKAMAKAQAKYVSCITKATLKCEGKGTTSAVECNSQTGVAAGTVDPKAAAKYPTDLAKCDDKLESGVQKKCTDADIVAAGCAGGSTTVAAAIASIEDATGANATAVRNQLPSLGGLLSLGCTTDTSDMDLTSDANLDCAKNNAAALSKAVAGLLKCQEACEDDYKGSKGGGGDDDGPDCSIAASTNAAFLACKQKADDGIAKAVTAGKVTNVGSTIYNVVLPGVLTTAGDTGFNSAEMCP